MKTGKLVRVGLWVLIAMVCVACGNQVIRGAAPIVRMNELGHQNDTISLQLSMRNLNGVVLDIQSIDFSLSVEDKTLFEYNGPADTNIVANGTETWNVDIEESEQSKQLLNSLQSGETKSLPYSLEGSIDTLEDGTLHFRHTGHIYPVPGRPGRFR